MNYEAISVSKFLSRYLNFTGSNLKKITHDDIKVLFPFIEEVPFYELKDNVYPLVNGEVILVSDGKKTKAYKNPELNFTEDEEYIEILREEVPGLVIDDGDYDYSDMNEYELKMHLRRKYNSYRVQNEAKRELRRRGIVKEHYKRNNKIEVDE